MTPFPWAPAVATGVGSLPGTQAREAANTVSGELPHFVHVPELPARGPGSDAIGRTAAILDAVGGFALETTPDGWRLTAGTSSATRRAVSWLNEDLDAIEEFTQGYAGPIKDQIVGPWTFAAAVELASGERMLRDPGACRDLADALAEAARIHVREVQRRVPAATCVLQWDEPGLPSVLSGSIGTASGLSRYAAVEGPVAEGALRTVLAAATQAGAFTGVHCCAADPPLDLLRTSGAQFVSLDLTIAFDDESLGRAWEAGVGILAGCVPSLGSGRLTDTQASRPIREAASRLGLTDERYLGNLAITPTCGLAGASEQWMRTAIAACTAVGRVLRHDHDEVMDGE